MSEKGIFLDILPRFDMAAAAVILTKVQSLFKKAGVEAGAAFGSSAEAGLRTLQGELVRTENATSAMYARMVKARGDYSIALKKYNEIDAAEFERNTERSIRAQARLDAARAKSQGLNRAYAAQQAALDDANAAYMAKNAAMMEGAAAASAARMNAFGAAAAGTLLLIGAKSADAAGKYEASLAKIQSTTGESADAIKKLGDGLLQLGPQVGYSAQELQNAAFLLAKSRVGFNDANAQLGVLKAAAQLAKVEGADLTDVMNGLTTTMVDFHVPAEKAADVASQLRVTVGAAKAPLDQFMGALHNFEPIMKVITQSGGDAASSIGQVGAMLAQMTQNGMSADQASQNLRNTLLHLIDPSGPQRNIMGQLGLTPDDLSKQLSDPEKGPIGVMKIISDRIAEMAGDTGHVVLDAMYKNPQATANMNTAFSHLTGQSLAFAQSINNGVMPSMKDLHKQMKLDPMLAQWMTMRQKVEGFSDTLKKNQDLVRTLPQIFKNVTGTDQGMMVFSQLFGNPEDAEKTIELWHEAAKAKADANGDVEGTGIVKDTYKFKLDAAKAAWHSLTIQMGEAFLPTAKVVMDALAQTAEFLSRHQGIMNTVVKVLEALTARWLFLKAAMVIGPIVTEVAAGFGKMWTAISGAFEKTIFGAKSTYRSVTDAAIKSSQDSILAAEKGATAQVQAQERIAAAAQLSADKQIAATESAATAVAGSATKQATSQNEIAVAGQKANTVIGSERAVAAKAGAAAVEGAAIAEVAAEERVAGAAGRANGLLAKGGGLLSTLPFVGSMLLPSGGDSGQDVVNTVATGAALLGSTPVGLAAVGGAAIYDFAATTSEQTGPMPSRGNHGRFSGGHGAPDYFGNNDTEGHAGGGPIKGSGPKGKDSVLMWGAPGEHVLTSDEVDKLGGHSAVYALRSAIRGYDAGGEVGGSPGYGNFSTLSQWLSNFVGGRYSNATGDDCSGITSQIINVAMGRPALESKMTTRDAGPWLAARGFRPGFKGVGAINVGWYNHGNATQDGHMAVTLPDGVHAEMGGPHGNFLIGPGAAGAESGEFDHHMYLPIAGFVGAPGAPGSAGGGGAGSSPYSSGGGGGLGSPTFTGGGGGFGGAGGGGTDWSSYNPLDSLSGGFTLQNLAKFATMFLANLALGNPIGRMLTAKNTGGQIGGLLGAESNLPTNLADITREKSAIHVQTAKNAAIAAINKYGEGSPQAEKAVSAYRIALDNATASQIRQTQAADTASTRLDELNGKLKTQNERLAEQTAGGAKQSTIDATLGAIQHTTNQIDKVGSRLDQLTPSTSADADTAYVNDGIDAGYFGRGLGRRPGRGPRRDRGSGSGGDGGGGLYDITHGSLPGNPHYDITGTVGVPGPKALPIIGSNRYRGSIELPPTVQHGTVGAAGVSSGSAQGSYPLDLHGTVGAPGPKSMPIIGSSAYRGELQGTSPKHVAMFHQNPDGSYTQVFGPVGNGPHGSPYVDNIRRRDGGLANPAADAAGRAALTASAPGKNAYSAANKPPVLPPSGGGMGTGAGIGGGFAPAPQSLPSSDMSRPASGGTGSGFGVSGGILGSAEGAASMAAAAGVSAMAPGAGAAAGAATDIMTKEANRFIGYLGQVAGIGVSGLLETFGLNDSPLSDPSKSLIGKIAGGLAGAHPTGPNAAGMTAPPLKKQDDPSVTNQTGTFGDLNINNHFNGTNDNADQVNREQNRAMLMYGGGSAGQ